MNNHALNKHYRLQADMRKLSYCIVLFALGFSAIVSAQQDTSNYGIAASAYELGNYSKAETLWARLANQGNPQAQYALGIMHLKKEAQQSEDTTAFAYLRAAAKQQHVAAMFNLGVAYWEGRGVARQPEKALYWWQLAAKLNDTGAQYNLGLAYYIGEGQAKNMSKAVYWVQQAANNGHSQARSLLPLLQSEAAMPSQTSHTGAVQVKLDKRPESGQSSPVESSVQPNSRIYLSNKTTILHAAPDLNSAQVLTLKAGTSVRALSVQNEWTQIMVSRSFPVWVYESFLQDLGEGKGIIKGNNVNIRPTASQDNHSSPPLGQLNDGQRVRIVSRRNPWIQVMPPQPFPAWVITQDIQ